MSDEVASLELCKELYELTKWYDTFAWYSGETVEYEGQAGWEGAVYENTIGYEWCHDVPAYAPGYLFKRLPTNIELAKKDHFYACWYPAERTQCVEGRSDNSSADALCKLAIKLIKQGVIKP